MNAPKKTSQTWKPETEFGTNLQKEFSAGGLTHGRVETEPHESTAGDIGTVVGALLGGLGGTPLSVGIGATVGKLAGEGANDLGIYWYNLAGTAKTEGGTEGGSDSSGTTGTTPAPGGTTP